MTEEQTISPRRETSMFNRTAPAQEEPEEPPIKRGYRLSKQAVTALNEMQTDILRETGKKPTFDSLVDKAIMELKKGGTYLEGN